MTDKSFRVWADNRSNSPLTKFHRWRSRPLGTVVRTLETLFLGAPLQQIIRSNNDVDEIRHLLPNLTVYGTAQDLLISDARVSIKSGLVMLESGHVIAGHLNAHSFLSGNLTDEVRELLKRTPGKIESEIIYVLPKQEYFYHFLIDYLPHLIRLHQEFPNLSILIDAQEKSFVIEYLRLLKYEYAHAPAKTISAKKILVPNYKILNTESVEMLLNQTLCEYKNSQLSPKKIAFLRFRGPRHDSEFEGRMKAQLITDGYEIFDPETLSLTQQIQLFSGADEIVSIHGGVLANLIFCKKGTVVHEIFTHPYRTLFFMAISNSLGLNYSSSESANYAFN